MQKILPNGIEYRNGYPDFSPVTLHAVRSPTIISSVRTDNFKVADRLLAERLGITPTDVSKFRKEQFYTWHEKEDMRTFELVPSFLQTGYISKMDFGVKNGHLGGFSEVGKLK